MKNILFAVLSAASIVAHASPATIADAPRYAVDLDITYHVLSNPDQFSKARHIILNALQLRENAQTPFFVYVHSQADADLINGWLRASGFDGQGVYGAVVVPVSSGGFSNVIHIHTGG